MSPKRGAGAGLGVGMLRGRGIPFIENKIEFKVSWFLACLAFWFQSFLVSKFIGFLVSWFQNCKVSTTRIFVPTLQISKITRNCDPHSAILQDFKKNDYNTVDPHSSYFLILIHQKF